MISIGDSYEFYTLLTFGKICNKKILYICNLKTNTMNSGNANQFEDLSNLIFIIRGLRVMLDADLAAIYGYETRSFNQQVKNNIEKFDADFRFQITKEEYHEILRSKKLTSNILPTNCESVESSDRVILTSKKLISKSEKRGGRQHLPYVFTEQGIYMLMTVLKGELAVDQSKALIRTFKGMKDYLLENRCLIGNNELVQLSLQTAQNTADIAEIKNTMITQTDLAKVVRDFTDPMIRREYLILNGESVDANIAYSTIYKSAKSSVCSLLTTISVLKRWCCLKT